MENSAGFPSKVHTLKLRGTIRSRSDANGAAVLSAKAQAERFRDVVMPHLGDALALARWLTGNPADAEDVVQDACIKAHAGIAGYAGGNARAWVLTIVRNTSYSWMARNRPRGIVAVGGLNDLDDMSAAHGADLPDSESPEASLIAKADAAALEESDRRLAGASIAKRWCCATSTA